MKHQKIKISLFILLVFIMSNMIYGCAPAKRPVPKPTPKAPAVRQKLPGTAKPAIPKKISKGVGKEPVLRVYDVKTQSIRELPLEQYIEGVVAGEMKNDWPEQALEAQAIIARTFVLQFVTEKGGSRYKGADVSTDIKEAQAWNAADINDRVKKAIQKTRGKVMVYQGKYPNAWFHSNAGGITASAKEGLNFKGAEPPYIQVIKSPDAKAPAKEKSWTVAFPKAKVITAINASGKNLKDIHSIKIGKKGPSGRAETLMVDGVPVSAPELRISLGSMEMKSTLLDSVSVRNGQVVIKGRGYGHGVGMSQWGAYSMAKEGKKASEIIKYYFKGVQLVDLWK